MADEKKKPDKHIPLHKRLNMPGAELGIQNDQKSVITIAQSYIDQMKAGTMVVEAINEIDLGDGRYARTFIINEEAKQ